MGLIMPWKIFDTQNKNRTNITLIVKERNVNNNIILGELVNNKRLHSVQHRWES